MSALHIAVVGNGDNIMVFCRDMGSKHHCLDIRKYDRILRDVTIN